MKFQFPLNTLLRHRKLLENEAQRVFQEANSILNAEISKLENMHEQVRAARQSAGKTQVDGALRANDLHQVDEFLKGQDIRIERQKVAIQKQGLIVEELREILRKAAIDYKIIDKHREKKQEEFRVELRKFEQKQADDLVNARQNSKEEE